MVWRRELGTGLVHLIGERNVAAMGRQIARDDALAALHERHAILFHDLLDLLRVIFEREFDHIFEEGVGLAHADGDLELQRDRVVHEIDRDDVDRLVLDGLHPAGEWAKHRRDIKLTVQRPLHHIPRLMLRHEIAVVGLSLQLDVVDDATFGEGCANARSLEHADLEVFELGIVEARQLKPLVVAIDQNVGRLVDGEGGEQAGIIGRNVEHHIAHALLEGLTCQTPLDERTPVIFETRAQGPGKQLGHLVLEAFALDVGQGHVARIGADIQDLQLLGFIGSLGRRPDGDLLAGREIVVFLAEVSLRLVSGRVGGRRRKGDSNKAKAQNDIAQMHGGTGLTCDLSGAPERLGLIKCGASL